MMRDINLTNFFLFFVFWLKILTFIVMLICARQKQLAVISVEKHPLL